MGSYNERNQSNIHNIYFYKKVFFWLINFKDKDYIATTKLPSTLTRDFARNHQVAERTQSNCFNVFFFFFSTVRSCSLANSDNENMNIVLRNASGVIKSPWYPHGFPDALEDKCHWKIIAPKGKVVRIEFLSFRVYQIYAQISDRINRLNPRTVKFSGKLPSFNFYSTGNELSIMIKGYFGNRGAGFIANYSSIDSGEKRESVRSVP